MLLPQKGGDHDQEAAPDDYVQSLPPDARDHCLTLDEDAHAHAHARALALSLFLVPNLTDRICDLDLVLITVIEVLGVNLIFINNPNLYMLYRD